MERSRARNWMDFLEEDEIAFIKKFLLSSGSLKDMAAAYNVTYPTMRLRLDRLIAKITALDSQKTEDDYERLLQALFAEGKLDAPSFKQLLRAYEQQKKI